MHSTELLKIRKFRKIFKYVTISVGQFMSRLKYGRAKLIAHGAYLDMIQVGPLYKPENATIFHGICSV